MRGETQKREADLPDESRQKITATTTRREEHGESVLGDREHLLEGRFSHKEGNIQSLPGRQITENGSRGWMDGEESRI
ncbi:hypothetical protein NQZ68_039542 [Dissostichus eleginoides]|nr:hypothetical protein NQZ68_039542 [Dissostichus eleginoides]